MGLVISISPETIFQLGSFGFTNSALATLIVSAGLILFSLIISSKTLKEVPIARSLQNVVEIIFESLLSFYESILGSNKARSFFPFLTTIFLFILISSWSGLIPGVGSIGIWGQHGEEVELIPLYRAPTADLNTTLALALIAMAFVQWQGFKTLGAKYLGKFFTLKNPIFTFVGLLEFMGEFTKIISFAFRLFGNIFAGEVLLSVMSFLIPVVAAIPFLGLEIFVGFIQSFVFVLLVMVFSAGAAQEHGEHH